MTVRGGLRVSGFKLFGVFPSLKHVFSGFLLAAHYFKLRVVAIRWLHVKACTRVTSILLSGFRIVKKTGIFQKFGVLQLMAQTGSAVRHQRCFGCLVGFL